MLVTPVLRIAGSRAEAGDNEGLLTARLAGMAQFSFGERPCLTGIKWNMIACGTQHLPLASLYTHMCTHVYKYLETHDMYHICTHKPQSETLGKWPHDIVLARGIVLIFRTTSPPKKKGKRESVDLCFFGPLPLHKIYVTHFV